MTPSSSSVQTFKHSNVQALSFKHNRVDSNEPDLIVSSNFMRSPATTWVSFFIELVRSLFERPIDSAISKQLIDKIYEKRKAAALDLEK